MHESGRHQLEQDQKPEGVSDRGAPRPESSPDGRDESDERRPACIGPSDAKQIIHAPAPFVCDSPLPGRRLCPLPSLAQQGVQLLDLIRGQRLRLDEIHHQRRHRPPAPTSPPNLATACESARRDRPRQRKKGCCRSGRDEQTPCAPAPQQVLHGRIMGLATAGVEPSAIWRRLDSPRSQSTCSIASSVSVTSTAAHRPMKTPQGKLPKNMLRQSA